MEYTVPKSSKAAEEDEGGPPRYNVPKEWTQVENKPLSIATFQIGQADDETFLTITPFGVLNEAMLLPNVNRWRGQVGLPGLEPGEKIAGVEDLPAGKNTMHYLKIAHSDIQPSHKAMLIGYVNQSGQSYIFKLMGNAPLVLDEEARFKSFIQSVRFSPKEEADDE